MTAPASDVRDSNGVRSSLTDRRGFDGLVVAAITALTTASYVGRLGFSSDDWVFISEMQFAGGTLDKVRVFAENPNLRVRPTQSFTQIVLHDLLGTNPRGYHVVAALLLVAMAVTLWACLVTLGAARVVSFMVPVAFATSPVYATDRFWFATLGYTITLLSTFVLLACDLRAVRGATLDWRWKVPAWVALTIAVLGYEVVVPLLVLEPLSVAWWARRHHGEGVIERFGRRGAFVLVGTNWLLLLGGLVYKATQGEGFVEGAYREHLEWLGAAAVGGHFGSFGVLLPHSAWWAAKNAPMIVIMIAVAVGVAAGVGARHALRDAGVTRRTWVQVTLAGFVLWLLGYAVFLFTSRFDVTTTGIGTRTGMAAALGSATVWVGVVGMVGTLLRPPAARATATGVAFGLLCACFVVVTGTLAESWVTASRRQREIVATVAAAVSENQPAGTPTVILDGVCPYEGPAPVFENHWDLWGALRVELDRPDVQADVRTTRLTLTDRDIETQIYGMPKVHPYGPSTLLVDVEGNVTVLVDRASAEAALASSPFDPASCPGSPGRGEDLLPVDRWLDEYRR